MLTQQAGTRSGIDPGKVREAIFSGDKNVAFIFHQNSLSDKTRMTMMPYAQKAPKSSYATGNLDPMLQKHPPQHIDFRKLIITESPLESMLLELPEFREGLNWGVPRFGHPEGKVGFHVIEVLNNIASLQTDPKTSRRLRICAIAHDTFKNRESESIAAGNRINHGLLARQFMENHIDDDSILDLIELHDEIYYSWRHEALQSDPQRSRERLDDLLDRIGDELRLHYLFFRCDTLTGDKIQAPRYWFEKKLLKSGEADLQKLIQRLNGS